MDTRTDPATAPSWVRYSGLVIILAALLDLFTDFVAINMFPDAFVPGTRDAVIVGNFVLSYLILGSLGAVALYVYYENVFGWIGKVGLILIVVGAGIGVVTVLTTGAPGGNLLNLFLVVFVGAGFLAVSLWQTPSIPRSAALLMGVTPVAAAVAVGFTVFTESFLGILGFVVMSLAWSVAWIILGYHLWQQKPEFSETA